MIRMDCLTGDDGYGTRRSSRCMSPCRAREADTAHLAVANGPAATAAAWVRLV